MFKRVLHVRRVARTTMRGKIRSTHVMAVVGNGRGSAGLGESTASDPRTAVERAIENAQKNMHYFERFENRTVPCEMERTHHKTHVRLDPARPGYGIFGNNKAQEICRAFGLHDVKISIKGSSGPINVIKATFDALLNAKTPKEMALIRGRRIYEVVGTYFTK